jgi:hypothetical protein
MVKFRKSKKHTSVRRRYASLNSNEQIKLKKLKKVIKMCFVNLIISEVGQENIEAEYLLLHFIQEYFRIKIDRFPRVSQLHRQEITIDLLDHSFATGFLRFDKPQLRRIYNLMQFGDEVILENRSKMNGEEIFIRGLYELATGHTQTSIADLFGRHYTDQGRAFKYFINHVYEQFHTLVDDNLAWWFNTGLVAKSAELIGVKSNIGNEMFTMSID